MTFIVLVGAGGVGVTDVSGVVGLVTAVGLVAAAGALAGLRFAGLPLAGTGGGVFVVVVVVVVVGDSAGVEVGDGPMIGLSGTTCETPGLAASAVASDCGMVAANASTR
jgi:hypothetical protein